MGQSAVQAQGEQFRPRPIEPAPGQEQPRQQRMQRLDKDFPQHQHKEHWPAARHAPAQQPQGTLDAFAAGLDVAALEGQFAEFAARDAPDRSS